MAHFEIGEIAIINCPTMFHHGCEVEIVSSEYFYEDIIADGIGYDVIIPGFPCKEMDSQRGEWFIETINLRKKHPPKESLDIAETKEKGAPTWRQCVFTPECEVV